MKKVIIALLLAAMALNLTACAGGGGQETTAPSQETAAATQPENSPVHLTDTYAVASVERLNSTSHGELVTQGGDIYHGKWIQFHSKDTRAVRVADVATGEIEYEITGDDFGHGNAAQFSKEFYMEGDPYPLMYVSSWESPIKLTVMRVVPEKNISMAVRTYAFDAELAGGIAEFAVDEENQIAYGVGYAVPAATQEKGNYMIMTAWDLSNCTTNADGELEPALISDYTYTLPYMPVMQDFKYLDGCIYLLCSYVGMIETTIFVIDVNKKDIVHTIDDFPKSVKLAEFETFTFLPNPDTNCYDLYIMNLNRVSYLVTFAD